MAWANKPAFGRSQSTFGGGTTFGRTTTFGQTNSSPGFGNAFSQKPAFGTSTTTNTGFGNTSSAFNQTSSGFGTSSFGVQQNGTNIKYKPTLHVADEAKGKIHETLVSITAMKEYETKSQEELRMEDYLRGEKGKGTSTSSFGSTGFQKSASFSNLGNSLSNSTTTGFGGSSGFGNSSSGFGTTSGFGNSGFNNTKPAFGTATTGGFGTNKPAFGQSTGGFGNSGGFGNKPAFGTATTGFNTNKPGFGTATTGGFGTNKPAFGQSTGGFGNSGGFGNKPAFGTATTGGFGNKPAFGTTTTGGFGNKPAFGTATTGGFGTNKPAFGQSTGGFGGFGTGANKPAFGTNNNPFNKPAFGTATTGAFGMNKGATGFTSTLNGGAGKFGFKATTTTTGFGQGGMFGQNKPLFGQSTLQQQQSQQLYQPPMDPATALRSAAEPYGVDGCGAQLVKHRIKETLNLATAKNGGELAPATQSSFITTLTSTNGEHVTKKPITSALQMTKGSPSLRPQTRRRSFHSTRTLMNQKSILHKTSRQHSTSGKTKQQHQQQQQQHGITRSPPPRQMLFAGGHDSRVLTPSVFSTPHSNKALKLANSMFSPLRLVSPIRGPKPVEDELSEKLFDEPPSPLRLDEHDMMEENANEEGEGGGARHLQISPLKSVVISPTLKTKMAVTPIASSGTKPMVTKQTQQDKPMTAKEFVQKLPKLDRKGYYMKPSLEEMIVMTEDELSKVYNFTVGREGFGWVRWYDPVDVRGLDLDDIIDIEEKTLAVYDNMTPETGKPARGSGLNKPAEIELCGVFPGPKNDPKRFHKKIQKITDRDDNMLFLDYQLDEGKWRFRVEHFSRYGLVDSDDEDDMHTTSPPKDRPMKKARFNPPPRGTETPAVSRRVGFQDIATPGIMAKDMILSPLAADNEPPRMDPISSGALGMSRVAEMQTQLFGESKRQNFRRLDLDDINAKKQAVFGKSMSSGNSTPLGIFDQDDCLAESLMAIKNTELEKTKEPAVLASSVVTLKHKLPAFRPSLPSQNSTRSSKVLELLRKGQRASGIIKSAKSAVRSSVDAGIGQGRTFHAKWSQSSAKLVNIGKPSVTIKVPHNASDKLKNAVKPNNVAFRVLVEQALSTSCDRHQSLSHKQQERQIDDIQEFLETELECSALLPRVQLSRSQEIRSVLGEEEETKENDSETLDDKLPHVHAPRGKALATLLHKFIKVSEKQLNNSKNAPYHKEYLLRHHTWTLINALWGIEHNPKSIENSVIDDPAEDDDGSLEVSESVHVARMTRRLAFAKWLERTLRDLVPVPTEPLDQIFYYLCTHRLSEAVNMAMKVGDYRLGTLIAQGNGDVSVREDIGDQLDEWLQNGVSNHVHPGRLRILRLLAGDMSAVEVSDHWLMGLGALLWYGSPMHESLVTTLKRFSQMMSSGEFARPSVIYERHSSKKNILMELLELFSEKHTSLNKILDPSAFVRSETDYRLSWHLMWIINQFQWTNTWSFTKQGLSLQCRIASSYCYQLESMGLWYWAVYTAMRIPNDVVRENLVKELLMKHCSDDDGCEFIYSIGIPEVWIHRAKAIRFRTSGDWKSEMNEWIKAGGHKEAHDVIMKHLVPECLVQEVDLSSVEELLKGLDPNQIPNWIKGGGLILDYLQMRNDSDSLLGRLDNSEDFLKDVYTLQAFCINVCERLRPGESAIDTLHSNEQSSTTTDGDKNKNKKRPSDSILFSRMAHVEMVAASVAILHNVSDVISVCDRNKNGQSEDVDSLLSCLESLPTSIGKYKHVQRLTGRLLTLQEAESTGSDGFDDEML